MKIAFLHKSLSKSHPNILKVTIMQIADNVQFITPILAIFMMRNGLSVEQFFFLMSLYNWSWLLLEIPSGYLSDWWGRKPTLILSGACTLLGYIMLLGNGTFWEFALALILLAAGSSFESGTMESIVHESLEEANASQNSREVLRRIFSASFTAQAIGAILGGILATVNIMLPVYAALPFLITNLLIAFSLKETKQRIHIEAASINAIHQIIIESFIAKRSIGAMIIIYSIISTITLCLFWVTQPYQEEALLPLSLFGLTHALMQYANAWVSRRMISVERKFDDTQILIGIAITLILACLLASIHISLLLLPFLLIGRSMFGAIHPFTTDTLNKLTTSSSRATVHSLRQFSAKFLFAVTAPIFGVLASDSLSISLIVLASVGGVSLLLALMYWRKIPKNHL